MAIALAADNAAPEVGSKVVISGSGFTAAGVVNLTVSEEAEEGFEIDFNLTASAGAFSFTLIPGQSGHINITAHDVTANSDTSLRVTTYAT